MGLEERRTGKEREKKRDSEGGQKLFFAKGFQSITVEKIARKPN